MDPEQLLLRMYADDIEHARKAIASALDEAASQAGERAECLEGTDLGILLAELQKDIQRFRDNNVGTLVFLDRLRRIAQRRARLRAGVTAS